MKKWESTLVSAIFLLSIGAILLLWAFSVEEPIKVEFLDDTVHVSGNPWFLGPLMFGWAFLGMGMGCLATTYIVYKLERKLAE